MRFLLLCVSFIVFFLGIAGGTPLNTKMGHPIAVLNVEKNTPNVRPSSSKRTKSGNVRGRVKIGNARMNEGKVRETTFKSSLGGVIPLIKELKLSDRHKE